MIIAKINPVLSIATQNSLFSQEPQFITGSHLVAKADNYNLGDEQVRFQITYGECIFSSGSLVDFKQIHSDSVVLDGDTITNWGTDDSVILTAIAEQQGTSVVETFTGNLDRFGF